MVSNYSGTLLRVDLTSGKVVKQICLNHLIRNYLGGSGIIARILYDEVKPKTDAFDPTNRLIFAVGPLSGTLWPQSGRVEIGAKSPLTGIYGDTSSGGDVGPEIKFAGYDGIIIQGRSSKPVYLWIDDDKIELRDAKDLWGKGVIETEEIVREELGDPTIKLASIGIAGENLVRFASIMCSTMRAAARAGIGAVMGSKKLKAIAIRGSKDVEIAHFDEFVDLMKRFQKRLLDHPYTTSKRKYGTPRLVEIMNEIARFPTRNFQTGVFPYAEEVGGEKLFQLKIKDKACFGCLYACDNYLTITSGKFKGTYFRIPEYETLNSFGSRVGNRDLKSIVFMNRLCNDYGMDSISTGGVIAFAMELYEKCILTDKDTGGMNFNWDNPENIISIIHSIAHRKGFGDSLAEGTINLAKKIGKGSYKFAMHVKGMDISAQDGRAQKSMGLAHAVSSRGADHLKGYPTLDESGYKEAVIERFGKEHLLILDRLSPIDKALLVKDGEELSAIADSVGVCKSGIHGPAVFYWPDLAKAISLVTGMEITVEELKVIGERIVNLERAFNIREGIGRKDDTLPDRFLYEPAPDGPAKGQVVELDLMLDQYYDLRGWNKKTGFPSKRTLRKLGLDNVIKDIYDS